MNEAALIAQGVQGSVEAFNQLVLHYQQAAYNVAYRILGDADAATDATQDAFIRCYNALDQFHGPTLRPWLLRIVTNCCYDQLRARFRRPATPIDDLVEDEEASYLLRDDQPSPEQVLEQSDLNSLLQNALAQLPPEQRAVVVLADIEQMSYEEIALVMSLALGTVKSRLNRARSKLRDYMLAHKEQLPDRYRLS